MTRNSKGDKADSALPLVLESYFLTTMVLFRNSQHNFRIFIPKSSCI